MQEKNLEANTWSLNNMLQNNECVKHSIKEEILKKHGTKKSEHTMVQNHWETAEVFLSGKYVAKQSQEPRKISNKHPQPTPKEARNRTIKVASQQLKEGNNIKSRNKMIMKQKLKQTNKKYIRTGQWNQMFL